MPADTSLTPQEVAERLKIAKNTVYELIKRGELRAYNVGRKLRIDVKEVETFKGNPSFRPVKQDRESPLLFDQGFVICGQDGLLDILSRYLENHPSGMRTYRSHRGSYNGLFALYQGEVHTATAHLWDGDTGEYNISYVKKMLPGIPARIVHLVKRMQGFYVAKGNPKGIRDWQDLLRADASFINREKGSGTRVLLDEHLRLLGKSPARIRGYENTATSHLAVASAVARNEADAGLGNEKAALQVPEIDFVPLQKESYDLVMYRESASEPPFTALMEILSGSDFRNEIKGLGGYDTSDMGRILL